MIRLIICLCVFQQEKIKLIIAFWKKAVKNDSFFIFYCIFTWTIDNLRFSPCFWRILISWRIPWNSLILCMFLWSGVWEGCSCCWAQVKTVEQSMNFPRILHNSFKTHGFYIILHFLIIVYTVLAVLYVSFHFYSNLI